MSMAGEIRKMDGFIAGLPGVVPVETGLILAYSDKGRQVISIGLPASRLHLLPE
jgi:hypothetical protein